MYFRWKRPWFCASTITSASPLRVSGIDLDPFPWTVIWKKFDNYLSFTSQVTITDISCTLTLKLSHVCQGYLNYLKFFLSDCLYTPCVLWCFKILILIDLMVYFSNYHKYFQVLFVKQFIIINSGLSNLS